MASRRYPHHAEAQAHVAVPPATLFDFLDDPRRLGSRMEKASWRTLGSSMHYVLDAQKGREVGAEIRMEGRLLGARLWLLEVVTEWQPPWRKVWETVGQPRLLVIGNYRMGFQITAEDSASMLHVFIDYEGGSMRPAALAGLLGRWYAQWCVSRMAQDARLHFDASPASARTVA